MKSWWKSFKQFWKLSIHEKISYMKIAMYLTFFLLTIKMLPFNKFLRVFKIIICNFNSVSDSNVKVKEVAQSINRVSRHLIFDSTCLIQALTAKVMLRNVPDLVLTIGVSLENGFEAHAWVERNGNFVIGDTPANYFTPIWRLE